MAVLLPTQLPSVLEYNNFVSTHNFYSDAIFLTSISVTVTAVTVYARNTSNLLIVVGNTNIGSATTGTFTGIGTSIRISGYHFGNFDYENWKYRKTKPDDTQYSVVSYSLLPGQYFSLWNYTADVRTTTTITIGVQTSVGNFTLTQTLYNNWDVGRDNMYRLVYLSDINRYSTRVLATSSLTYLSGIGLVAPLLRFDGTTSALSTWVNQGAVIDSTTGLTAVPSYRVSAALQPGAVYAYTSVVQIGSLLDKTITFNINLTTGNITGANFYFGCNSLGVGPVLRLGERNGPLNSAIFSGFTTSSGWTAGTACSTGAVLTAGTWNRIAINISSSNVATWYLNNVKQATSTVSLNGTYIGLHTGWPPGYESGGNFDDIVINQNITSEQSSQGGGITSGGGVTVFTFSANINANVQNYNIKTAAIAAGWDQVLPLSATVTIAAGVYVWSDTTGTAGLATGSTFPANTVINIINNGYIIGKGGNGALAPNNGGNGGPALSLGYNINLINNSYIAGGGGGGAASGSGGGGGAGGGAGGNSANGSGGAGGSVGLAGANGIGFGPCWSFGGGAGGGGGSVTYTQSSGAQPVPRFGGGGGGGRILPGVGGGINTGNDFPGGVGGSANNTGSTAAAAGGGGGGWGAAGGGSTTAGWVGGAGGKAIELNGYTVTYITTGTLYGAAS